MEGDDIHLAPASKHICSDTVNSSKDTTDGKRTCPISSQPHIGDFSLCNHSSNNGFKYIIIFLIINIKKYDDRFNAFKTWPKSYPIKATNVARAITAFLSPDFHELWRSVMSICLLTEDKRQWATLVLGLVIVSVLDQLWDVSKLEFLCVTRLLQILVHYSCL